MNFATLLLKYEEIQSIIEKMLVEATHTEWEALLNLQAEYDLAVHFLDEKQVLAIISQLPPEQKMALKAKITAILNQQTQLKKIIDLHRVEIGELIGEQVNSKAKINSYNNIAKLL